MSLFRKTDREMFVLKTEQQRDAFIERLENAHVDYEVSEERDDIYSRDITYIIRVRTEDLKKVS